MHAPQIIWICFATIALAYSLVYHGRPKIGEENAFAQLLSTLISAALLYWGGFFG